MEQSHPLMLETIEKRNEIKISNYGLPIIKRIGYFICPIKSMLGQKFLWINFFINDILENMISAISPIEVKVFSKIIPAIYY